MNISSPRLLAVDPLLLSAEEKSTDFSCPYYPGLCNSNYKVEEDEVGGTCGTNGREEERV
jgi:hypothetical protein